jgi:hypothetical protein
VSPPSDLAGQSGRSILHASPIVWKNRPLVFRERAAHGGWEAYFTARDTAPLTSSTTAAVARAIAEQALT